MLFGDFYNSPLGEMFLLTDENAICGCYFVNQKSYPKHLDIYKKETNAILEVKKWLDIYYSGKNPDYIPKYILRGTNFQLSVWENLMKIPYGTVTTYGEIARAVAKSRGMARLSAQAVGNAIGANPISIMIPCHRIIGSNGQLTGYAGGLEKKIALLELEGNVVIKTPDDLKHSKLVLK